MISVVMPLYNKVRHVGRALDSVLAQSLGAFEVVVVNDGSTDGSEDFVTRYADPRIRLVNQPNTGVSAARNRGIAETKGDLVAFLDADDEWLPEHLTTICQLADRYRECGAYATAYRIVRKDGRETDVVHPGIPEHPWEGVLQSYFRAALRSDPLWTSAVAVSKEAFKTCGPFPVGVRCGEDVDMWCRVALKYPIAFSTHASARYYQDAGNRTSLEAATSSPPAIVGTLDEALRRGGLPAGIAPDDLREYRNKWLIGFATNCLLSGERKLARDYCAKASSTRVFRWWRLRNKAASLLPSVLMKVVAGGV